MLRAEVYSAPTMILDLGCIASPQSRVGLTLLRHFDIEFNSIQ